MGEGIGNNRIKEEELKKIVQDLHEGSDLRKVKKQFDKLIRDISPEEIANVEQSLINEGELKNCSPGIYKSSLSWNRNPTGSCRNPVQT